MLSATFASIEVMLDQIPLKLRSGYPFRLLFIAFASIGGYHPFMATNEKMSRAFDKREAERDARTKQLESLEIDQLLELPPYKKDESTGSRVERKDLPPPSKPEIIKTIVNHELSSMRKPR